MDKNISRYNKYFIMENVRVHFQVNTGMYEYLAMSIWPFSIMCTIQHKTGTIDNDRIIAIKSSMPIYTCNCLSE